MAILGIDSTPEDQARRAAIESKANGIFIASLISILFCCLGGIIASILAHRAKYDAAIGNLDSAERRINMALIFMILSYIVGCGSIVRQLTQMR
jgi:Na+-driven multidrug efflux pump